MLAIIMLVLKFLAMGIKPDTSIPAHVIAPLSPIDEMQMRVIEWEEFHAESVREFEDEFTALFESYRVKRTETRIMVFRQGETKFARSVRRA